MYMDSTGTRLEFFREDLPGSLACSWRLSSLPRCIARAGCENPRITGLNAMLILSVTKKLGFVESNVVCHLPSSRPATRVCCKLPAQDRGRKMKHNEKALWTEHRVGGLAAWLQIVRKNINSSQLAGLDSGKRVTQAQIRRYRVSNDSECEG